MMAKELMVRVGYGHIACKIWGDSTKATHKFIAVHGWLDNAGSFDPLMPYFLNKERCVVCIDLPGHGLSSHLPSGIPYSKAIDVQAMRSVIRHLDWQQYHLLGHSMGAVKSQIYALSWPREIISVLNLDAVMMPHEHAAPRQNAFEAFGSQLDRFLKFRDNYSGTEREHTWEELASRWLNAVPDLGLDNFTILMERGSTKLGNGKYIFNRDAALHNVIGSLLTSRTREIFKDIQTLSHVPQLHIVSSNFGSLKKDQPKLEETMFLFLKELAKHYPNKMEVVKYGGPHHLHMSFPRDIANIVNRFLLHVAPNSSL
ncbi:probable serine hydrolase [Watersipora subatra]|uniref:probable serine hydrolase n=1 Tax=Watersipora subatra TaxID=2589382 RepID=UPI00355C5A87